MTRHHRRLTALAAAIVLAASMAPGQAQAAPPAAQAAGAAPSTAPAAPAVMPTPMPSGAPANAAPAPGAPSGALGLLPENLSPWGMFLNADIVVKAVISILALAVVLTWTIWLVKVLELMVAGGRLRRALRSLRAARSLSPRQARGWAGAMALPALCSVRPARSGSTRPMPWATGMGSRSASRSTWSGSRPRSAGA